MYPLHEMNKDETNIIFALNILLTSNGYSPFQYLETGVGGAGG